MQRRIRNSRVDGRVCSMQPSRKIDRTPSAASKGMRMKQQQQQQPEDCGPSRVSEQIKPCTSSLTESEIGRMMRTQEEDRTHIDKGLVEGQQGRQADGQKSAELPSSGDVRQSGSTLHLTTIASLRHRVGHAPASTTF
ncbi:hypothetical protein PHSY_004441 [Pseudozyma hubeiensis SY62]|uniref:Uncharacterized protein n=1 Tax=Pseudozyma hubeiensis (strain SY62) TaxID=1305764 RepID=R9P6K9_PSEHS|nr:hypothetical protein PHSY_004441 [Pseudozyma hubeiensis SY62]GAC96857.1 hypothetical protein PHSY_004441 [Pseudozyma hubeiensis SY62]